MQTRTRVAAQLALCAALLFAVSCRTAPVLTPDITVPLSTGKPRTEAQVAAVIKDAGKQLGWTMEDAGPGHITGTLHVRKHIAVTDITYSPKSVKIGYKDSHNLRYSDGKIHRNYNNWVKHLADTIQKRLASEA